MIEQIRLKMKQPLPGSAAQYKMAGAFRQKIDPPNDVIPSAVMILLYPKATEFHFLLMERTSTNPNDKHSGQMSFPGGRRDPEDIDFQATALRELNEEIGIDVQNIEILGKLTTLYIPVSNFIVHPFLGIITEDFNIVPQASEVKSVISVPLNAILTDDNIKTTTIQFQNGYLLKNVPYFDLEGKIVWGATAMMLSELREILM